jgi:hypothetical protein
MANPHGNFIWYELITTDSEAAARFYGEVVGWQPADSGVPGIEYRILSDERGSAGGIMTAPPEACEKGMRSGWLGYIGVDDVDAAVAELTQAGGAVHMAAEDIPGVGRIAMVADPQGVPFYLMRGASDEASTAFDPKATGRVAWNELVTTDQVAALEFYIRHFGWEKAGAMPMGELGDYVFIAHGGVPIGAAMNRTPSHDRPMWNFYFRVADIDSAAERVRRGGGEILDGPMEVPGGDYVIVGRDPQGAGFGLVGSRG